MKPLSQIDVEQVAGGGTIYPPSSPLPPLPTPAPAPIPDPIYPPPIFHQDV
jgi:hypothetical protein